MAPDAGLGVAVVTNASSFLAGHEAQYDISLGLVHLLLDEERPVAEPSLLMGLVVPVLAWIVVAVLLAAFLRDLRRLLVRGLPVPPARGVRDRVRHLWPGAALLAVGAALSNAPLGLARHFYPDGGWALTVAAGLTVVWGATRTATGIAAAAHDGASVRVASPRTGLSRVGSTPQEPERTS